MSSKKRWNPDIKRHQRTRPEHMGEQNLTKEMINAMKTDEQTIALQKQINDMVKNRKPYKSFWTEENLHEKLEQFRGYFKEQKGYKPKFTMWAIRAAITGRTCGADMTAILAILGKENSIARAKKAIK